MTIKALFATLTLAAVALGFALPQPRTAEAEPRAQVEMLEIR